jgi:hypothetical protein
MKPEAAGVLVTRLCCFACVIASDGLGISPVGGASSVDGEDGAVDERCSWRQQESDGLGHFRRSAHASQRVQGRI